MDNLYVPIAVLSQIVVFYFIFSLKRDNKKLFQAIKKLDELQQPLWDFVDRVAKECTDSELVKQAKLLLKKRPVIAQ